MDGREQQLAYAAMLLLAAGLAWQRGNRIPAHRIVGGLLTWQLASDVLRMSVAPTLDRAGSWPYRGSELGLYFLDHALTLSLRFTILGAVWVHFGRWRVAPVIGAYAVTLLGIVAYKLVTGATLVPAHQWIAMVTASVTATIIAARALGVVRRARAAPHTEPEIQPDGAHAALLVLAATDLANALTHASHTFDQFWSELRYADTLAVMLVALGYSIALGKEAADRWRQPSRP